MSKGARPWVRRLIHEAVSVIGAPATELSAGARSSSARRRRTTRAPAGRGRRARARVRGPRRAPRSRPCSTRRSPPPARAAPAPPRAPGSGSVSTSCCHASPAATASGQRPPAISSCWERVSSSSRSYGDIRPSASRPDARSRPTTRAGPRADRRPSRSRPGRTRRRVVQVAQAEAVDRGEPVGDLALAQVERAVELLDHGLGAVQAVARLDVPALAQRRRGLEQEADRAVVEHHDEPLGGSGHHAGLGVGEPGGGVLVHADLAR